MRFRITKLNGGYAWKLVTKDGFLFDGFSLTLIKALMRMWKLNSLCIEHEQAKSNNV